MVCYSVGDKGGAVTPIANIYGYSVLKDAILWGPTKLTWEVGSHLLPVMGEGWWSVACDVTLQENQRVYQ